MIKLNQKAILLAALICGTLGFTASCGGSNSNSKPANTSESPKTGDVAKTGEKIGVAECDEYIEKLETCLVSAPEATRASIKTNLDSVRQSWKQAAMTPQGKSGLATGCKAALDSAKQSYSFCKW